MRASRSIGGSDCNGSRISASSGGRVWAGGAAFIQLYGTEGIWGMYAVEIPPADALNPERHLYEEVIFVVEGRGAAEVWVDTESRPETFEWQPGSLFTIPLNTHHRLIDRYEGGADYFKANLREIEPDPHRGLAMVRTNIVPDAVNWPLPLDNRRSPGFRRLEPYLDRNVFYLWLGEHQSGRYSKAHAHESAAVLMCLKGKGYTYAWPREIGTQPWETGQSEKVVRQDYEPVGMVSAAPMGGQWFHQHFGVGREPLRLMAWFGPFGRGPGREPGRPGETVLDKNAMHLEEGGSAIPYWDEDPYVRREYEQTLRQERVESRMEDAFYRRPAHAPVP